jgi:hypothetical protein
MGESNARATESAGGHEMIATHRCNMVLHSPNKTSLVESANLVPADAADCWQK